MTESDFLVIGGGIAGLSVAYELSAGAKVAVLESESAIGYHSTGRSAAVMSENYGPSLWRRLVTASRAFLERPPAGFARSPLLAGRGALFLALEHERFALEEQADELRSRGIVVAVMPPADARSLCPVIRHEKFALALHEPDCRDIDTNELMSGYARGLRARGGILVTDARVTDLDKRGGHWEATTPRGHFRAPTVVNAAGAWVCEIAEMAGLAERNVTPFRRTAVTFDPPVASDVSPWPMTFDVGETFYFKPEAGRLMVSPVDREPSAPCDAQADELEVAMAVDRIHTFTTMQVKTIKHKWGGLRTFAPDHAPVIGADPADESFVWLAGQGGNGVMAGPAAGRLAASIAAGEAMPDDVRDLGIDLDDVSPARESVSKAGEYARAAAD